jgi:zinc transport system permease protein
VIEALHYEFMRNALLAGLLASIACGIIGTLVVVNRIVFISGGIAHAAYGGIGIAFFFGLPPMAGAAGFSLLISAVMGVVTLEHKYRADTIIGVLWAVGMALGVILIDLTPGYNVDLMSYLFGSILAVPASDLWLMGVLDLIITLTVIILYKEFLALSYDEEFALIRGIHVRALYFLLLGLVALSVVMIIRVVGLILVLALLTIPPYLAERYTGSIKSMMACAILFSLAFTVIGLGMSYVFNLTSGATVIMVGAAFFCLSTLFDWIRHALRPAR